MRRSWGRRGARAVAGAGLVVALAMAGGTGWASGVPAYPGSGPWEANLTHDPQGQDGEPSVAVNPLDPDNVIVTYLQTGGAPGALLFRQALPRLTDEVLQPIQSCRYLVTHDGGQTWRMKLVPVTDILMSSCADTYVLFDRHGTAYIMAGTFSPAFPLWDEIRVISSVDGGETWSYPAVALRNTLNPGSAPLRDLGQGRVRQYIDRYWMALDDATGDLYITAVQTWVSADGTAGPVGPIVVSHDGGRTWSDPSLAAPVGSPFPAAGFGLVATTFDDPACGCMVFAVSGDGGRTFTRKPASFRGGKGHAVADPTQPGRFAVLAQNGPDLRVYLTEDAGDAWSGGALVTQGLEPATRTKTWIAFSRNGVLGVGWRNTYADGSYEFYAAVSADGGRTWGLPRRVSTEKSPPQHPVWVGGNDTSDLQFGPDDTLYAAWDDWRTGDMDVFWGGFPTRGPS